jgi:hypothetical protein
MNHFYKKKQAFECQWRICYRLLLLKTDALKKDKNNFVIRYSVKCIKVQTLVVSFYH